VFIVYYCTCKCNAEESREQLLESALLNQYYPLLRKSADSQFECESVVAIKRLGEKNEFVPQFEVKVQLLTFQGAHNPPHDIVTVTIKDTVTGMKIITEERKQNVSREEVIKACEQWRKKFEAHKNKQLSTP
jgi:thiamine kinase-like enzyme